MTERLVPEKAKRSIILETVCSGKKAALIQTASVLLRRMKNVFGRIFLLKA